MNHEQLLEALPFPYRLQSCDPYGLIKESKSPFFDCPKNNPADKYFWESIKTEGWRQCPQGYSVYARTLPGTSNQLLIIHGLKIKGTWKSRGITPGLSIVVERAKVLAYMNSFLAEFESHVANFEERIDARVRSLVTESIHEIRSMNTSLYHAGYELQEQLLYGDAFKLALAKNVVALSELISARIELADLVVANSVETTEEHVPPITVYKKFEKITKCYIAYAKRREISITISGGSHGQTQGISNFDMIPLVVVDNAVKYSPPKENVDICFLEELGCVVCEVKSLGPKIENSEKSSIFERETRGIHAIESGQSGNGIGLFFANKLMKSIGGSISIGQREEALRRNGKNYFKTVFRLHFGKSVGGRLS